MRDVSAKHVLADGLGEYMRDSIRLGGFRKPIGVDASRLLWGDSARRHRTPQAGWESRKYTRDPTSGMRCPKAESDPPNRKVPYLATDCTHQKGVESRSWSMIHACSSSAFLSLVELSAGKWTAGHRRGGGK